MKHRKRYIIVALLMTAIFMLSGCATSPKTFDTEHISVTLTKEFTNSSMEGFDSYIKSDDVVFTAKQEKIQELEAAGYEISSLNDYCMELLSLNNVSSTELKERDDYKYFVNSQTVNGSKYTYVHCMFESKDSFWICEFVCKSKHYDKYEDKIFKWADSIEIKD